MPTTVPYRPAAARRHKRHTLRRVVLCLILLLLAATAAVGGWIAWTYHAVDPMAITKPFATLEGEQLPIMQAEWTVPILGEVPPLRGKLSKNGMRSADIAVAYVGSFAKAQGFTMVCNGGQSSDFEASFTLYSSDGTKIYTGSPEGFSAVELTENGAYSGWLKITWPKSDTQPYGEFEYYFTFDVEIAPDISFSGNTAVQGDVMTAWVDAGLTGETPTIETELGNVVEFVPLDESGRRFAASIPVNYSCTPGDWDITVKLGEITRTQTVAVTAREYTKQYMTIDTGTVDSTMNNPEGPANWRERVLPLRETADEERYWSGTFVYPCDARKVNTEFGLYRYTNGSASAERHLGVDFGAKMGDDVYAANAGRVVLAEYVIYTGNTVVIEHGGGLKTYYFHMNDLAVSPDEMVTAGQVIGHVGTTGYSTGAHLHFEVRLGAMALSPWELLDGSSGLYYQGPAEN